MSFCTVNISKMKPHSMGSRLNISYRVQVGNPLVSQPPAAPSKIPVVELVSRVLKAGEVQVSSGDVFCTATRRFWVWNYETWPTQTRVHLLTAIGSRVAAPLGFSKETKDISCHQHPSHWDRDALLGWVQHAYSGRHHPRGEGHQDLACQQVTFSHLLCCFCSSHGYLSNSTWMTAHLLLSGQLRDSDGC